MFKIVFLQFLYHCSDREVEDAVPYNLRYKWFLGLAADERPPDHTALCRFRARLGHERFQALFNRVVAEARQHGLVTDVLPILDSTDLAARVDLFRLKGTCQDGPDDQTYVDRHSPAPDARFGRKPPTKGFYGYKLYLAEDVGSELITAVHVTPGHEHDGAQVPGLVTGRPPEVVADQGYNWPQNHQWLRWRPSIERKCAELTGRHRLARCRYWGLANTTIQAVMTAFVVNGKRLVRLLSPVWSPA